MDRTGGDARRIDRRAFLGGTAGSKLERVLSEAGVAHDVKEHTDVGHSFLNDHDPDDLNALVVMLAKVSNSRYHEPSAQDAREPIVAIFDAHLHDDHLHDDHLHGVDP